MRVSRAPVAAAFQYIHIYVYMYAQTRKPLNIAAAAVAGQDRMLIFL